MAIKILRQFMAENRHKLPTSKDDLKNYIVKQGNDLRVKFSEDQIEALASEFVKQPETPILEGQDEKLTKPSRKR